MTAATGNHVAAYASGAGLDLPPGFRAVPLREFKNAVAHAASLADAEGAGTLTYVRRFDLVEFAVVLEPDEPLPGARRALYAVMNAAAAALAVFVPPEKPVTFDWPDTIRIDGGIVGGVEIVAPPDAGENEVPAWLVAGVVLRSVMPIAGAGTNPYDVKAVLGTGLDLEGVDMLDGTEIIERFARYLMKEVERWREDGFDAVAASFIERLAESKARRRAVAASGDLVERGLVGDDVISTSDLARALADPRWRDPATGEPWL
jgi:hypothetical protein